MTKREQAHRWVLELIEAGLTMQDIQREAGVHFSTLRAIREGKTIDSDKISGRIFLGIKALHDRMFGIEDPSLLPNIRERFERLKIPATPAELYRMRNPKTRTTWDSLSEKDRHDIQIDFNRLLDSIERAEYIRYDAFRDALRIAIAHP